jgi:hypothetical protein
MKILSMFGADSRRTKAVSTFLCLTICLAVCLTAGCNQNTIAALVSTLAGSCELYRGPQEREGIQGAVELDRRQESSPGRGSDQVSGSPIGLRRGMAHG